MRWFELLFWGALVLSYVAAMVPQEQAPQLGSLSDKAIHFIAFSVLTLLLRLSYGMTLNQTFAMMFVYAVFIELSQIMTSDRSAELLDIAADSIGIVIGLVLYRVFGSLLRGVVKHEVY